MAVNDHGLEVLKKSGEDVSSAQNGSDTAIKTLDGGKFSVPKLADAFTRECVGNTVEYKFRQGGIAGTVLKTVTLYYQTPQDPDFTGGSL